MVTPSKVAAVATAAVLAITPTTAVAAKRHHTSAARTCAALTKKEGVKRFDARFGTGKKHTRAMARCIRMHTATKKKKS
jgi:hypothetical protein